MDDMMSAVVFKALGEYEVTERPVPRISEPDDMLIKIEATSICGTDVHILHDPPGTPATIGAILGHEFVGTVIETGSAVKCFKAGDKMACDPNVTCGTCAMCQLGHPNLCSNVQCIGIDIDGGFAQYVVVPEKMAVKLPSDMSWDDAIFAEPLNCVMGGMSKIKVLPGETALVCGAGPIGLYFTSMLKANGAGKVIVSEVSAFRSPYALKCGADRVIDPSKENLEEEILKETDGLGVDIAVDAVGVLINDVVNCTRPAGRILLFGQNLAAKQEICEGHIQRKGLELYGNYIGHFTLSSTIKALSSGIVDFKPIITHKLPLRDFAVGMEAMRKGEALEVVLYPFD
jgi:threonine dehydrogenase-like Zn-dependent dehydrogenase